MALISENSRCAICDKRLNISAPLFATSGLFPVPGMLLRYCDAPMHWNCYAAWPHRKTFAAAYVRMWIAVEQQNPSWAKVWLDEFSFVTVNPDEPMREIAIRLFATGSELRVRLDEWEQWLHQQCIQPEGEHPVEKEALAEALPVLRTNLPTAAAILSRVDYRAKRNAEEALRREYEHYAAARRAALLAHNRACLVTSKAQLRCPYCGGAELLLTDGGEDRKSFFQCQSCGRTCWPDDLKLRPN